MHASSRILAGLAAVAVSGAFAGINAPAAVTGTTTSSAALVPTYRHPGRILASNCFQCHGTDGKNGPYDSLAGESASELYHELKELQTSTEADKQIMRIHALGYSDDQLRLIADYFANVR